jgi:predicted ester cyclase
MSREEMLAFVRQLRDVHRRREVPRLKDLYAADAIAISPMFGEVRGPDAIGASWTRLFSMIEDLRIEFSDLLIDGERIALLGKSSGTDRKGWFGLSPTGGPIEYRLVVLLTVIDGKIVREERIYDSAGVLERLEKAHLDQELKVAAEVQRALFFRNAYTSERIDAAADSLPCRAIGGDFFELMELPSGNLGIALGDVAGKGPPAALLAAMIQGMLGPETAIGGGPAEILARINRRLVSRRIAPRFATLVYVVLSPAGTLVYSNAGHNPPVLLSGSSRLERLEAGGPILGAFRDARFDEERLDLGSESTLVIFSDGVTDATNPCDDEFGESRLLNCLDESASRAPSALLSTVVGSVREFCQQAEQKDDITVAVAGYHCTK